MGLLKESSSHFLLRLQWIAGLLDLVVIALLPQYFLIHANISLFIFLALAAGFVSTLLGIKLKDKSFVDFQLLIVALNALLAFAVSFHDFASIRWVGPLNVFAGSFLCGVFYKFSLFDKIFSLLKTKNDLTISDLEIDKQLIDKINKFAPIKYILKNKSNDPNQIIELLEDINRDLNNSDLEFRIQELESKFSKDLSEVTFNELKELKKKQNIN